MSARNSLRRLLSVAAVSAFAVAVMLGAASSASATTSATCLFLGAAGPVQPGPQPPLEKAAGVIAGGVPGLPGSLIDTGTYDFATTTIMGVGGATCVGATDTPAAGAFAANGNISSEGSYSNVVCGTGLVSSRAGTGDITTTSTVQNLGSVAAPLVSSANYNIAFAAGEGPLTLTNATGGGATLNNGDSVQGGGWVSILPTGSNDGNLVDDSAPPESLLNSDGIVPCINGDANAFEVQGFFTVAGD